MTLELATAANTEHVWGKGKGAHVCLSPHIWTVLEECGERGERKTKRETKPLKSVMPLDILNHRGESVGTWLPRWYTVLDKKVDGL